MRSCKPSTSCPRSRRSSGPTPRRAPSCPQQASAPRCSLLQRAPLPPIAGPRDRAAHARSAGSRRRIRCGRRAAATGRPTASPPPPPPHPHPPRARPIPRACLPPTGHRPSRVHQFHCHRAEGRPGRAELTRHGRCQEVPHQAGLPRWWQQQQHGLVLRACRRVPPTDAGRRRSANAALCCAPLCPAAR